MTHARLLDNLSGRIGDEILNCMASSTAMMMAVAFVRFSGVRLIEESLMELLGRGGRAEIILGLEFSLTEPRALDRILEIKTAYPTLTVFAFSSPYSPSREPAFHPKLYMFERADSEWIVIISSSNLSRGGLINNVEIGVALEGSKTDTVIAAAFDFYARVRGRESLFVPTNDYLEACRKVRSTIRRGWRKEIKRRAVKDAITQTRQTAACWPMVCVC
ncbi:MAG: phospholipase D-like domain-containing protein [Anaerolineae bacterium]